MGWFSPRFSSLSVSLSLQLTEKKAQNLTAEWLIQIIVAFSYIGLLSSLTLFFAFLPFHPVQCGIWATCELGPLSKRGRKKKKRKREWHQRGEKETDPKTWAALQFSPLLPWLHVQPLQTNEPTGELCPFTQPAVSLRLWTNVSKTCRSLYF